LSYVFLSSLVILIVEGGVMKKNRLVQKGLKGVFFILVPLLAAGLSLSSPAMAQQIILDGITHAELVINGNTTDVTVNGPVVGGNAFIAFQKFNVDSGNVVNLVVPSAAQNLVCIITSASNPTMIAGALNSVKNGQIGGQAFIVNPAGITVFSERTVNLGSATFVTSTTDFVDNFFAGTDTPDPASVAALLAGTAPINETSMILNMGAIALLKGLDMNAGTIINTGSIITNSVETGDIVNLRAISQVTVAGAIDGGKIEVTGGEVRIVADNVDLADGQINADSAVLSRYSAGNMSIRDQKYSDPTDLQLTPAELGTISANSLTLGNSDVTNTYVNDLVFDTDLSLANSLTVVASRVTEGMKSVEVSGDLLLVGVSGSIKVYQLWELK